ncbi:MAG: trypsin-like peptidase domain-containing protein [Clostridia bacterium]|nr:trypsin-like peptidase domain-containing protein [Clostridia bacterium]
MDKVTRRRLIVLALIIIGIVTVYGGTIWASLDKPAPGNQYTGQPANVAQITIPPGVGPDTIANIVQRVAPAVVKIEVLAGRQTSSPLFNDPFFRQFFGPQWAPPQELREGLGSGVIISPDGYILTNEHVINGARSIQVTVMGYEKPFTAQVVGSDYDLDLAVLKINAGNSLSYLKLGDSDKVRVGDWVIAIGNPYGLDHTVTVGVISAKGRPIRIGDRQYENLLQTDASINPGNSGGPLLNLNGEVIGINTAIEAQGQGLGFAIPTSTILPVLDDLRSKGQVERSWIGVLVEPLTPDAAEYLGFPGTEGVLVTYVYPGSPAEQAGVKKLDVFTEFNGKPVTSPQELAKMVQSLPPGQKVTAVVWRAGQYRTLQLVVQAKPQG